MVGSVLDTCSLVRPVGSRNVQVVARGTEETRTAALVRSAEAGAVTVSPRTQEAGRQDERVRRLTGQCPPTGQRLVDAVTGDQSTDRHLETDIDVRVSSQPCFLGLEAGASALASGAPEMFCEKKKRRALREKNRSPRAGGRCDGLWQREAAIEMFFGEWSRCWPLSRWSTRQS